MEQVLDDTHLLSFPSEHRQEEGGAAEWGVSEGCSELVEQVPGSVSLAGGSCVSVAAAGALGHLVGLMGVNTPFHLSFLCLL